MSSANEGLSRRTRRAHTQRFEFIKGSSTPQLHHTRAALPESTPTSKVPDKKRGKQKTTAAKLESLDASATCAVPSPAPRKRRKAVTDSVPRNIAETIPSAQPILDPSESLSTQSLGRTTRSSRRRVGSSTTDPPATPQLPSGPRRIILKVMQPENAVEQLLQRSQQLLPPELEDNKNPALSEVRARMKVAAVLAEKRAELCRNNSYLPLDRNKERRRGPPDEPGRPVDTWDVILKAVEATYRPEPSHIAVTRRICDAVKARAELCPDEQVMQSRPMRGTAKTKVSKKQTDDPETSRCKKLAKVTVELVIHQWKRVVLVSYYPCLLSSSGLFTRILSSMSVRSRRRRKRKRREGEDRNTLTRSWTSPDISLNLNMSIFLGQPGSPSQREAVDHNRGLAK